MRKNKRLDIAVIGGGAAGVFGAVACAESAEVPVTIRLFEAGGACLRKARIAGGGRCNLTHHCQSVNDFCQNYPRGARELLGPMRAFGPAETVTWFETRGVPLKTERDGRVFPASDTAAEIVNCLLAEADKAGVRIDTAVEVTELRPSPDGGFDVRTGTARAWRFDKVLLALGGGAPKAYALVRRLDHTVTLPAPALFGLKTEDGAFHHLAGLAVPDCDLSLPDLKVSSRGPMLFTQWGITGPAALKLSSLAAKTLQARGYKTPLRINYCPALKSTEVDQFLQRTSQTKGAGKVRNSPLFNLPSRLWKGLAARAGIHPDLPWSRLSGGQRQALVAVLTACPSSIQGKAPSREEMVTAGGVTLSEVNFKTMESKIHPGLHIAGELLDIDGLTGGFNLQAAWTTGYLAGVAMGLAPFHLKE
ncbi:MAG: aminoacetone oxidase family FAD-binding enzyme [Lentisphaeria bacterium]|nr:aminoacetone oxidase family FAD-binding enzyme [Lentisphaeria bacterium]